MPTAQQNLFDSLFHMYHSRARIIAANIPTGEGSICHPATLLICAPSIYCYAYR